MIKFAIGHMDEPDVLLQIIFERLAVVSRKNYLDNLTEDFIKSLGKELAVNRAMDMQHNKYFNYITDENPVICIPSRFYVFKSLNNRIPESDDIDYQVDETESADYSAAECFLSVDGNNTVGDILKMSQNIPQEALVTKFMIQGFSPQSRNTFS